MSRAAFQQGVPNVTTSIQQTCIYNRKCSKRTLSRLLAVALRMYLTLHLLLFGQSMLVLIAIGFKYLILLQGKLYSNKNQSNEMLSLCLFFKIIVCKDDDFSAFRTTKFMNENFVKCTRMYTRSMQNGIDCCNNQPRVLFLFQPEWD